MRVRLLFFIPILLLIAVIPAAAHGFIERSQPEDGAVLSQSPEMVKIWFSEPLQPDSGAITIVDGAGNSIESARVYHDSADNTLLIAELPPILPESAYIVTASAIVISDAHAPSGSIVFWVGEKSQAAAQAATDSPAYGVVALFFGVMLVFGGVGIVRYRREFDINKPDFNETSNHYSLE